MLLYYITDRSRFPGTEAQRRSRLLEKIAEAARAGIDFIQLREKNLPVRDMEALARDAVAALRSNSKLETRNSKLLINHRTDIALAARADGVHLRSDDISAADARAILSRNEKLETRNFFIAVSCHTAAQIALAESQGADFAVFAPVFEKSGHKVSGLEALRQACARAVPPDSKVEAGVVHSMPVLALGGVTLQNAPACLDAGAAGIAGIRLFQENDTQGTVEALRALDPGDTHVARPPSAAVPGSGGTVRTADAKRFPTQYRRRLPHLQREDKPVFVTFRCWGTLVIPESLRDSVLSHCLHDDGQKIIAHAVVVMPEHVHMLFTPITDFYGGGFTLVEILNGIKGASAHTINKALRRSGPVWQDESFDHVLRSAESLEAKTRYICQNPVRRGLAKTPEEYRWLWVRNE